MQASYVSPQNYYSSQIKKLKDKPKAYLETLINFLKTYKVDLCTIQFLHDQNNCFFYHDDTDKRRNPYGTHQFVYSSFQKCDCFDQKCNYVHNNFQNAYHPLLYKTVNCQKYTNCLNGLYCIYAHQEDIRHFQNGGQFFRFDLCTFKTLLCYKRNQHERKTCLYYHNDRDKRRNPSLQYNHFVCTRHKCTSQNCQYSHNKIQQLYHPSRYKSKFCQSYPNNVENCQYKQFCSFAHTQDQIMIDLIHFEPKDYKFYVQKYKTVWCPFTQNHDRGECPYAHNIQDFRRNPNEYSYESDKCQYWNFSDDIKSIDEGGCKFGISCKKCHGWMEHRYHPSTYNKKSKSLKKNQKEIQKDKEKERQKQKQKQKQMMLESAVQKKLSSSAQIANSSKNLKQEPKAQTAVTSVSEINSNLNKKGVFAIGTPFFKSDRCSQSSGKTKAKTICIQSQKSIDGRSNIQKINIKKQIVSPLNNSNFPAFQDQNIWKDSQAQNLNQPKEQTRARSQGKSEQYQVNYSNSIKDTFQDNGILSKLRKQKINQVQIVNMDEKKIKKLSFLTLSQQNQLSKKLQKYNLKRDPRPIQYSKQLTKFFVKKKFENILQKMMKKKVKEAKLVKLIAKQINQLSFLSESEKNQLPKLLKDFQNDKEFNDLNKLIVEDTQIK